MSTFILYGRAESGNSYKAALMLELSRLDWRAEHVGFLTEEAKPSFRSDINEQGEVPVLEHDGKRLSQTGVILSYLADRTGSFAPVDENERLEVLRWILFDNHKFTSYYATLRFLLGFRKTGETAVTAFLRTQARSAFAIVEERLRSRPFVVGSRPTIADISMVGYMYYDEATGIDWEDFPNIRSWAARVASLPRWAAPYDLLPRSAPPSQA